MALQGTLETFALPDVLRLLSSTKKTGSYKLSGDGGSGSLWLREGQVVGGESPSGGGDPVGVVFELLRFSDGDFVFDESEPPEGGEAKDVEELLAEGERLLGEWDAIAAVVPSLEHSVSLRVELPSDEVTIRADHWIYLVALRGGATVGGLGARLGQGELDICRAVKELVELGVVEVGEPGTAQEPEAALEPEPAGGSVPAAGEEPFDPGALVIDRDEPEPFEPLTFGDDDAGGGVDLIAEPAPDLIAEPAPDLIAGSGPDLLSAPPPDLIAEPAAERGAEGGAADAAEIARQLASLSPKAAKAVAAAAKATTIEEREAALADVPEEEQINRDLLLKFLGSVNT